MIVPKRLSAVGQVAGVAVAALCCYLVSQSVAAERAGLARVDREIAAAHDDIAKLHTEIGVRGRMGQLERWNTEVLALQAPRPGQFVASGVQLASLYGRKGAPVLPLDPAIAAQQGAIDKVAYQPAAPQAESAPATEVAPAAPPPPMLRQATFVRPAADRLAGASPVLPTAAPLIEKASFQPARPAAAPKKPPLAVEKAPPRASASLLPADIGQLAAREAKGTRDSNKAAR